MIRRRCFLHYAAALHSSTQAAVWVVGDGSFEPRPRRRSPCSPTLNASNSNWHWRLTDRQSGIGRGQPVPRRPRQSGQRAQRANRRATCRAVPEEIGGRQRGWSVAGRRPRVDAQGVYMMDFAPDARLGGTPGTRECFHLPRWPGRDRRRRSASRPRYWDVLALSGDRAVAAPSVKIAALPAQHAPRERHRHANYLFGTRAVIPNSKPGSVK
jgi:hypothetical protein